MIEAAHLLVLSDAISTSNKNLILKYFRCRDEKEQKQELGWRVSVLPITAFHCTLCTCNT